MRKLIWAAATALALIGGPALAADEEIQVYMDELNPTHHFGLDVHINYVTSGDRIADWPGQQQSLHRLRVTPEFSFALSPNWELGAYLPLMTAEDGHYSTDGVKGRIKFLASRPEGQHWFWGANFELGRVDRRQDINPWNAELKGILGTHNGPWTLAMNANVDWAVKGPDTGPTTLQIATRASYDIAPDFTIGVENYNDLGPVRHLGGDLSKQEQAVFLTVDKGLGDWDLQVGVGRGYGDNSDNWILKAMVGIPIDRRK
jgi:hypothetical protein